MACQRFNSTLGRCNLALQAHSNLLTELLYLSLLEHIDVRGTNLEEHHIDALEGAWTDHGRHLTLEC